MYGFVHVVLIAPLWLLTIFNFCELTRGVILGCAFIQQHTVGNYNMPYRVYINIK